MEKRSSVGIVRTAVAARKQRIFGRGDYGKYKGAGGSKKSDRDFIKGQRFRNGRGTTSEFG